MPVVLAVVAAGIVALVVFVSGDRRSQQQPASPETGTVPQLHLSDAGTVAMTSSTC
jgi:hypothetical protein